MERDNRLVSLALRQGGVVTIDQVRSEGFTRSMVAHRLNSGAWKRIGRTGYRVIEMGSWRDLLRAAVATLPGAVVSHEAAAELHDIPMVTRGLPRVTVHTRTTHAFPGVVVVRSHDLIAEHTDEVDHLPVTTIARTLVDLARRLSEQRLGAILDELVATGRLWIPDLEAVASAVLRRGKPGASTLRSVLAVRGSGEVVPASVLERKGRELLRFSRIPDPIPEYPIPWDPSRRWDDAWPACRVALEWDSRRWHSQVEAMDEDRRRDNEAQVNGWRLLRFTWVDVTRRQDDVIATVRRALAG